MLTSLLVGTLALASTVHGYFNSAQLMQSIPFQGGMASAVFNNSMILFGGENATTQFSSGLYQLTQTSSGYTWNALPQANAPVPVTYAQGLASADGLQFMVLGGNGQFTTTVNNATTNSTSTVPNTNMTLLMQAYTLSTGTWKTVTTLPNMPANRFRFAAAYDASANNIYVFGGVSSNNFNVMSDLYVINSQTGVKQLASSQCGIYGHTATIRNGKLIVLGGMNICPGESLNSMNQIQVYDIASNTWSNQKASGTVPSTRIDHSAVLTPSGQIVILGGSNGAPALTIQYLRSIAVLDTSSYTWSVPNAGGIPPSFRSLANAAMLDGTHITYVMGEAMDNYYNDINVLDTSGYNWLQSFSGTNGGNGSSLSTGAIVGVAVGCAVVVAIVGFLLYRFWGFFKFLVMRIHSDIWSPRSGEPIWAETTRIIFQILFIFIFAIFMVFVIRQAIESPNVVQRIETGVAQVDTPDVRFCFDGYSKTQPQQGVSYPGVACQTDIGYSCNSFIHPLDMSKFQPFFTDNLGPVTCFLYRAPSYFQLTGTSGQNNGSRLIFSLFGDNTNANGRVHVSVYPKAMDPNQVVYGISDDTPSYLSTDDVLAWQNNERNDVATSNVYTIEPFTYSAMSYELVDHRYLQNAGWNYVGFLPITNSTPVVNTEFRAEAPNPTYTQTHPDIGVVALSVDAFVSNIDREVKLYTLVNALGLVGGLFGLLIAVQAWLFGFRPRSPWGVVHRWSTGGMKRSLLRGLHDNFKTTENDAGIPLVHPVHKRFSVNDYSNIGNESETQRISRVEERMQLMELLFKAYYVDDELFREVDSANKTAPPGYDYGRNPMFPNNEKVDLQHGSAITTAHNRASPNSGGRFSHMFNHRNSVVSDNSQQNLNEQYNNGHNV
ncbi:galactose oxidase [Hesseltinella vesiculosa]|uniref:Galactose oxidase n=1 Tax=Hesseltinella vesiculosa TaxID=101127 RepID=A0A1X2GH96_9FUNG|nr:galactose oxidase [Hesseltinella vesiculosa]